MLSSAGHQFAIAIFMIIFFGLQFITAGIFLLYKRVGIPISLGGGGTFGVGVTIVKDNSADTTAALARIEDKLTKMAKVDVSTNEKVGAVGADVTSIRTQLHNAGRQAYFWNITSLVCGLFGVAIGIYTLNS